MCPPSSMQKNGKKERNREKTSTSNLQGSYFLCAHALRRKYVQCKHCIGRGGSLPAHLLPSSLVRPSSWVLPSSLHPQPSSWVLPSSWASSEPHSACNWPSPGQTGQAARGHGVGQTDDWYSLFWLLGRLACRVQANGEGANAGACVLT